MFVDTLSCSEVAALCGVRPEAVRCWARGATPCGLEGVRAVKVGKAWRWPAAAVSEALGG